MTARISLILGKRAVIDRTYRSGAGGVVGMAEVFRNAFFRRGLPFSTTPSAPLKEASRLLLDVASTPPVSGGEWRAQFIDICIDRLQRRNALLVQSAFLRKHWYYSRHAHAAVALSVDRIRRRVRSVLHLDQTAGARCRAGASSGSGSERSDT